MRKNNKNSLGSRNRAKGHSAERLYTKLFKEFGFSACVTARYGSKIHDDVGIDIINLPFNVQVKAGKQRSMNPTIILSKMKEKIETSVLESEHDKVNIIIHKKEVGKGKKRTEFDELVHLSFKDFIKLIKKIKKWD